MAFSFGPLPSKSALRLLNGPLGHRCCPRIRKRTSRGTSVLLASGRGQDSCPVLFLTVESQSKAEPSCQALCGGSSVWSLEEQVVVRAQASHCRGVAGARAEPGPRASLLPGVTLLAAHLDLPGLSQVGLYCACARHRPVKHMSRACPQRHHPRSSCPSTPSVSAPSCIETHVILSVGEDGK